MCVWRLWYAAARPRDALHEVVDLCDGRVAAGAECVIRCAYRLGAIAQTSAEFFDVEVADLGVERIA